MRVARTVSNSSDHLIKKPPAAGGGFHRALAPRPHERGCSGRFLIIQGSAVKERGGEGVRDEDLATVLYWKAYASSMPSP
jgi:hypothetical protein